MKKILGLLMALTALLFVFFPSYEALDHTYQTNLWTYPENDQSMKTFRNAPELVVRMGGKTGRGSLMRWHRVRLGIPFKAMTLDIQARESIVQGRFELIYLVVNLFGGLAVGFVISCFFQGVIVRRQFASRHGLSIHRSLDNEAER